MIKLSFVNYILINTEMVKWMLTVMPYLMISFIRSSSIVARKVSLGCSISGTTSSRIFATLQITMKSFCVYKDKISALWKTKSENKLYTALRSWEVWYYFFIYIYMYIYIKLFFKTKTLVEKNFFKEWREEQQIVTGTWILALSLTYHVIFGSLNHNATITLFLPKMH